MSNEMRRIRARLMNRFGDYGKVRFMWLCQCYGVMPWDEVPEKMKKEVWN